MTPKRILALLLGVLTVSPLGYLLVFVNVLIPRLQALTGDPPELAQLQRTIIWLHTAVVILAFGLLAFYVTYARRSVNVPPHRRAFWVPVVLFLNLFAIPVFWYLYVWRPASSHSGLLKAA